MSMLGMSTPIDLVFYGDACRIAEAVHRVAKTGQTETILLIDSCFPEVIIRKTWNGEVKMILKQRKDS